MKYFVGKDCFNASLFPRLVNLFNGLYYDADELKEYLCGYSNNCPSGYTLQAIRSGDLGKDTLVLGNSYDRRSGETK